MSWQKIISSFSIEYFSIELFLTVLEVFCVCLVFRPLVSVYGLFPVLVSCNLVNSVPGVFD